jgi:hypothetical protein
MRDIKQNTAANIMVFMTDSINHITGKLGLTLVITASKDGAVFATITPTVTERGSGWYNLALTTSHTDTLGDLVLHIVAIGADPSDLSCRIVQHTPSGIKKNTLLNNFMVLLVDSTDHITPKTGRTVTAERSIDGGAFGACSNSVSEVSNGMYKTNLSATDLNGDIVTLKFTALDTDARLLTIVTEP